MQLYLLYERVSVCRWVSVLIINRAATAMNCAGGATLRISCVLVFDTTNFGRGSGLFEIWRFEPLCSNCSWLN